MSLCFTLVVMYRLLQVGGESECASQRDMELLILWTRSQRRRLNGCLISMEKKTHESNKNWEPWIHRLLHLSDRLPLVDRYSLLYTLKKKERIKTLAVVFPLRIHRRERNNPYPPAEFHQWSMINHIEKPVSSKIALNGHSCNAVHFL